METAGVRRQRIAILALRTRPGRGWSVNIGYGEFYISVTKSIGNGHKFVSVSNMYLYGYGCLCISVCDVLGKLQLQSGSAPVQCGLIHEGLEPPDRR